MEDEGETGVEMGEVEEEGMSSTSSISKDLFKAADVKKGNNQSFKYSSKGYSKK